MKDTKESKGWAREEAVKAVNRILREGAYSNITLKKGLDNSGLNRVDKALVTEIVNGTLRNLLKIDYILSQFIKQTQMSPWIEDILRCAVYQIFYLDRIPDSAVCNESTELARIHGHEGTIKFVNGVLRNISRSKQDICFPDKNEEPVKYLSIQYSHPEWIVKKWAEDYGFNFTEALLAADNEIPPFSIRTNRLKITKEKLKEVLQQEGIEYEDGLYNDEALYIKGTSAIEGKDSFKNGYYQIQDESSMLVAHIVDPKPGETIVDVCSAPGGKTTHLAELMDNQGVIIARDIHENKLKLVYESCKRLGITNVKIETSDAREMDNKLYRAADRVLVDAPCSGLGVLRRKPDMRLRKSPDNFSELIGIQKSILTTASKYVKSKGVLVYSTCTINKGENNRVIDIFLEKNSDFYLENITNLLPKNLQNESAKNGFIELYPNEHKTDGFFIARMKRK